MFGLGPLAERPWALQELDRLSWDRLRFSFHRKGLPYLHGSTACSVFDPEAVALFRGSVGGHNSFPRGNPPLPPSSWTVCGLVTNYMHVSLQGLSSVCVCISLFLLFFERILPLPPRRSVGYPFSIPRFFRATTLPVPGRCLHFFFPLDTPFLPPFQNCLQSP